MFQQDNDPNWQGQWEDGDEQGGWLLMMQMIDHIVDRWSCRSNRLMIQQVDVQWRCPFANHMLVQKDMKQRVGITRWCWSNSRTEDYETSALPVALLRFRWIAMSRSTHSVVASYKPSMLVTGPRFPVCAFSFPLLVCFYIKNNGLYLFYKYVCIHSFVYVLCACCLWRCLMLDPFRLTSIIEDRPTRTTT